MRKNPGDEYATLVRYFLGELSPEDRECVEERYMFDDIYSERLDEVETDLIDAYVTGTITPRQRHHFESRYMVTRERRDGVQAAFLSRVYRERVAGLAATPALSSAQVRFGPRSWRVFLVPSLAALVIAMLGGAYFKVFLKTPPKHPTQTQTQFQNARGATPESSPQVAAAGEQIELTIAKQPAAPVRGLIPRAPAPSAVDAVIQWMKGGASESAVIERLRQQGSPVVVTSEDLRKLRKAGVSETVAKAMADPARSPSPTVVVSPSIAVPRSTENLPAGQTGASPAPSPTSPSTTLAATTAPQSTQFEGPRAMPPATPPYQQSITLPAGTQISIRTSGLIDSRTADTYKEYPVSVDDPVTVNGVLVVPANARAFLQVADAKTHQLGRASFSTVLTAVTLATGQRVEVKTDEVDSQELQAVKRTSNQEAAGAAIGAINGGAVGARIASAGGRLVQPRRGSEIPSETRLTYTLTQPVLINYRRDGAAPATVPLGDPDQKSAAPPDLRVNPDTQAGPDSSCAALGSDALEVMKSAPNPAWKSSLATPLNQIRSLGLNGYIQQNGGVAVLTARTRRDLATLERNNGQTDSYGTKLNHAWIDLLECVSRTTPP